MNKTLSRLLIAVLIGVIVFLSTMYTIKQGQAGLLLRMGKVLTTADGKATVMSPGLHFKFPFIDRIKKFDMRLQTDAAKSSRIYIERENYFVVDYYVKWRVQNLPQFYVSTSGDPQRAELLMQQKIDAGLRAQFGTRSLKDIVAQDRVDIMASLKKQADASVGNLGVHVIDVRLKAIDLPPTVRQSVFDSMRAGREKVANSYRAEGNRESTKIKAQADATRVKVLAEANKKAQKIRAAGVKKSAVIYNEAYQRDPKFYSFYRSLKAYRNVFNDRKDMIVLRPDNAFFKYFNQLEPVKKGSK